MVKESSISYGNHGGLNPQFVGFSVRSPAVLDILADPQWLAILVSILFAGKDNIANGVISFLKRIKGLNASTRVAVKDAVITNLENLSPELRSSHEGLRKHILGIDSSVNVITINVSIRVKKSGSKVTKRKNANGKRKGK